MKRFVIFVFLLLIATPLRCSDIDDEDPADNSASNPTGASTDEPDPDPTGITSDEPEPNPTGISTDEPGPNPTGITSDESTTKNPSDDCEDFDFWNGEECVPGIGADCAEDEDCKEVKDSFCSEGSSGTKVCTCPGDLFEKLDHSECLEKAEQNDDEWTCSKDDNCGFIMDAANEDTGTATCEDEKCQCEEDDWFINNVDNATFIYCNRMLGAKCEVDEECNEAIEGAVCDETCTCDEGYKADDNKMKCKKSDSSGASSITITAVGLVYLAGLISKLAG